MAEADLPYGHFGRAEYDADGHVWRFERVNDQSIFVRPLGEPEVVVRPTRHAVSAHSPDGVPGRRLPKQIHDLSKALPELQPAASILASLARVSEAVERAALRPDTAQGSLLSFGTVRSEADQHLVELAVFACGATGGDVRLVQIRKQRRGWQDAKDAWLAMPVVHGEESTWRGDGAPVQQVCFGNTAEPGQNFLAVRLQTRTVIFRPTIRRSVLSGTTNSRLDANPVLELPWKATGKSPHAHVSFNPWYNRQFGVVNQAGNGSVWELVGLSNMTKKRLLTFAIENESEACRNLDDGWARILWVAGPMTLAMCTRRKLLLTSLDGDGTTKTEIRIHQKHEAGWFLDVITLAFHLDHLCILTPTHILVHLVTNHDAAPRAQEVLRLRHYRNPDDLTLALMIDGCREYETIFVRSRSDPIIVQFRLDFDDNDIHVHEPRSFNLPDGLDAATIVGLHLKTVPIEVREEAVDDSQLLLWRKQNISFHSLFVLRSDLSLSQTLCTSMQDAELVVPMAPPSWQRKLVASTPRVRAESFVVGDDYQADLGDDQLEKRLRPISAHIQRRMTQTRTASKGRRDWTVNLEWTARQLQNNQVAEGQKLDAVLDRVEHTLQQQPDDIHPLQTLLELSKGELAIDEIEEASQRLADLALNSPIDSTQQSQTDEEAQPVPTTRLALRGLSWPFGSRSEVGSELPSLMWIYDKMVADWITPLPPHVTGRVRLAKERLVRQVAAEVALASHVIRAEEVPEPEALEEPPPQAFELPVRAGLPISSQDLMSSQTLPASSQSQQPFLPTPSATPSMATGTSYSTSFGAPEISRLSKYTTFTEPAPSALPRSLNRVLSHWTVGTDPAEYDWLRSTRQASRREDAEDMDHLDDRERERLRRKAERHLRRQRREAEASQAARIASSQAPQIASFSRAGSQSQSRSQSRMGGVPSATQVESQQVAQSSQSQGVGVGMPSASQVVPGRFGGRPAKKKRKQGF